MASAEDITEPQTANRSTLRVRRYRRRRRQGLRPLTVEMPDFAVQAAIARGLLKHEARAEPWTIIQACYASLLSDKALDWLARNGVITYEHRADAVTILRRISQWLEHAAR